MDVAGRYSHSKDTPLVFAAVGMRSSAVSMIRESLIASAGAGLRKWSNPSGNAESAKAVFRLIAKRQLYGAVNIIWKTSPAWDRYHDTGQELYDEGVRRSQEAMPYAKSMATMKIHLFGDIMADLYGHILGLNRHLLPQDGKQLQLVTVTAVFDSDIQGQACRDMFENVMGAQKELPRTEKETGIRTEFKISIKTEEEEPLLLLPDYLAGLYYSKRVYGTTLENERSDLLKAVEPVVSKWPSTCLRMREGDFNEEYLLEPNVFDHVLPKKRRDELLKQLHPSSLDEA
jgi:hypothetical protein